MSRAARGCRSNAPIRGGSFWLSYPIGNIFKSLINQDAFCPLIYSEKEFDIPHSLECRILHFQDSASQEFSVQDLYEIQTFLSDFFGLSENPAPKLQIPINKLLTEKDIIIILRTSTEIVASIRYKYLGNFLYNNEEIYCEDCFCVHPEWRNKGLGRYLLNKLHNYVNDNGMPYSMFLKEGRVVQTINNPIYSGVYVFRSLGLLGKVRERSLRLIRKNQSLDFESVRSLDPENGFRILNIFREFNNGLFLIINKYNTDNQYWKLYTFKEHRILACFQDTYQRHNDKKIGWCTGWIETPNLPEKIRENAALELSESVSNIFDMIWMNSEWTENNPIWKMDGAFHWYSYQWTSAINIKKSYIITV